MFQCTGGHSTADYRPMTRVPIAVREVRNEHYIPDPKHPGRFILVKTANGAEVVEAMPFCPSCAIQNLRVPPPVVNPGNPVIRRHVFIQRKRDAQPWNAARD